MTKYVQRGSAFYVAEDIDLVIFKELPVGTYVINLNEMSGTYSLQQVQGFKLGKVYGDVGSKADRILNTYLGRGASTGVLLSGEKGCGKTMLSKLISIKAAEKNIPTILVNEALFGEEFNKFVQSIDQSCVIVFDEYEKVYNGKGEQDQLLTLLDGVYPTNKLFILTTNDRWAVSQHMMNRPGRLFYNIEYTGLPSDFVKEYAEDNLLNKKNIAELCTFAEIFNSFNFDMLKALVEEMNRYNETVYQSVAMMNIKAEGGTLEFTIELQVNGTKVELTGNETQHLDISRNFGMGYYASAKAKKDGDDDFAHFSHRDLISIRGGTYIYKAEAFTLILKKVRSKVLSFAELSMAM